MLLPSNTDAESGEQPVHRGQGCPCRLLLLLLQTHNAGRGVRQRVMLSAMQVAFAPALADRFPPSTF